MSVEANFRKVYNTYRARANRKKIGWYLSEEDAFILLGSACHYCGASPSRVIGDDEDTAFICGTIDRLVAGSHYIRGACVPACITCNRAKGQLSVWAFKAWAAQLAEHLNEHRSISG